MFSVDTIKYQKHYITNNSTHDNSMSQLIVIISWLRLKLKVFCAKKYFFNFFTKSKEYDLIYRFCLIMR